MRVFRRVIEGPDALDHSVGEHSVGLLILCHIPNASVLELCWVVQLLLDWTIKASFFNIESNIFSHLDKRPIQDNAFHHLGV